MDLTLTALLGSRRVPLLGFGPNLFVLTYSWVSNFLLVGADFRRSRGLNHGLRFLETKDGLFRSSFNSAKEAKPDGLPKSLLGAVETTVFTVLRFIGLGCVGRR